MDAGTLMTLMGMLMIQVNYKVKFSDCVIREQK